MKTGKYTILALLGGALALPTFAEKVQLNQLPPHIQEQMRTQTGSARIEDIDRQVRDGRTFYEVGYKDSTGKHTELRLEDTGAPQTAAASGLDSRKISYSELPVPIRRVVDSQVSGGEVNDVERKVRNGVVTYEIGYKTAGGSGPQHELVVDQNGTVLKSSHGGVATSPVRPLERQAVTRPSLQSRTVNYSDLPQSVRQTAEANLRNGHVERAERTLRNNDIHYTLTFRKENGEYQQMVVSESGQIVSNQLIQNPAVGNPGTVQSGASTAPASPYSHVTAPVRLQNSSVVEAGQLPAEVRRVMREQTRNGRVEEILRGQWSGNQVYQISFVDQNQRYVELQVDQNGQVIYDPRTPATNPAGNVLNNIGRALFDRD
jgi:uncharacterized membrane protein YkoI